MILQPLLKNKKVGFQAVRILCAYVWGQSQLQTLYKIKILVEEKINLSSKIDLDQISKFRDAIREEQRERFQKSIEELRIQFVVVFLKNLKRTK